MKQMSKLNELASLIRVKGSEADKFATEASLSVLKPMPDSVLLKKKMKLPSYYMDLLFSTDAVKERRASLTAKQISSYTGIWSLPGDGL